LAVADDSDLAQASAKIEALLPLEVPAARVR